MVAAEFGAARDLQIDVQIAAAIGVDQLLEQLAPFALAVRIAYLQLARLRASRARLRSQAPRRPPRAAMTS
jgi:hypothetical protein